MPDDIPEFGKPWAADGETRPSHFRTPMAHARGANGGVVFVRDGHGAKETKAKPFVPPSEEQPWVNDDPEAE